MLMQKSIQTRLNKIEMERKDLRDEDEDIHVTESDLEWVSKDVSETAKTPIKTVKIPCAEYIRPKPEEEEYVENPPAPDTKHKSSLHLFRYNMATNKETMI